MNVCADLWDICWVAFVLISAFMQLHGGRCMCVSGCVCTCVHACMLVCAHVCGGQKTISGVISPPHILFWYLQFCNTSWHQETWCLQLCSWFLWLLWWLNVAESHVCSEIIFLYLWNIFLEWWCGLHGICRLLGCYGYFCSIRVAEPYSSCFLIGNRCAKVILSCIVNKVYQGLDTVWLPLNSKWVIGFISP